MSKIKIPWKDVDAIYDLGEGDHIIAHGFDFRREDVELV